MNNLYNKIYEAVNSGIQKALIISDDQSDDSSVKFHNKEILAEFIPYELRTVDLGLPSGLLWCEYNLGAYPSANFSTWKGNYYAWGETDTKQEYYWDTYKYYKNNKNYLSKYSCSSVLTYEKLPCDNIYTLEPEDDVITAELGISYRMPTDKNFNELIQYTTQTYVHDYNNVPGLHGMLLVSNINSKTLFFPESGYQNNFDYSIEHISHLHSYIWTSSLYVNNHKKANAFVFKQSEAHIYNFNRYAGYAVRGVKINLKN